MKCVKTVAVGICSAMLLLPAVAAASTLQLPAGSGGIEDGSVGIFLSTTMGGPAAYRLFFDDISYRGSSGVKASLNTISQTLQFEGALQGQLQVRAGSDWISTGSKIYADFRGSAADSMFETDARYGSKYWTSRHQDANGNGLDDHSSGMLSLRFDGPLFGHYAPSFQSAFRLKYNEINANSGANQQRQYRDLLGDGPFSFLFGDLAHWRDDVFKTWFALEETIHLFGHDWFLRGDIHAYGDINHGTEVPEPGTALLLGIAGLLGLGRRKMA